MTTELSQEGVEQALRGITIPPRPTLLLEIDSELKRDDPNLRKVADLIGRDVGIAAAMLKTVNSPLFALRSKVGNILQAVQLLGLKNSRNIVTSLVIRTTVGGKGMNLERFWDSSEKVAAIAAYICSTLPRGPRDDAYTFGIFHDCGIPILMQRFPDYLETLKLAAGSDRPLSDIEDERHGTNHATLGYMLGRSWGLSEPLYTAIQRHHDWDLFRADDNTPPGVKTLVAINYLAENLHDTAIRLRVDEQWSRVGEAVLDYLGLSTTDFAELREDVVGLCTA